MERSSNEIQSLQQRNTQLSDDLFKLEEQSIQITLEESKSSDIGTLRFISELFNKDIPFIVKWFTFAIIFVFDPLAIALVLAYNVSIQNKVTIKKEAPETEFKKEVDTIIKKFIKPISDAKYRD